MKRCGVFTKLFFILKQLLNNAAPFFLRKKKYRRKKYRRKKYRKKKYRKKIS